MNLRSISGIAQVFGVAVVDQVVLSGANFLVGFLLIRRTSDTDYGMFVLVQSAMTLLIAAQGAWLTGPLAVVSSKKTAERRREMVGAMRASQGRFLRMATAIALIAPPLLYYFGGRRGLVSIVFALGIVAGLNVLQREYLRATLLLYRRPDALFAADLVYVAMLLSAAAVAAYGPMPAAIVAVSGLALAAWAGGKAAYGKLAADPGWTQGDSKPIWLEMRNIGIWSTVGAVIYWLFTQSYNYILASRLDLSAVAAVNAARLLLMPTIVLTLGVGSLLMPSTAGWIAELGFARTMRRLLAFMGGIAVLDLGYFVLVWIFRDWLTIDFLHRSIPDRDRLLILWTFVALIGLARDVLQCALFALGRQKAMAWWIAASAVVSLSIMWIGLNTWGAAAALIGQIAGETVNLFGLIILLHSQHKLYSKQ